MENFKLYNLTIEIKIKIIILLFYLVDKNYHSNIVKIRDYLYYYL